MDSQETNPQSPQVPTSFRGGDWFEMTNDKDRLQLAKECLMYAILRFDTRRTGQILNINKNFNRYNGILNAGKDWLDKRYGKDAAIKYVDWRLGRTKIDLMTGEQIKRPMNATVYTINKSSVSSKLDNFHVQLGLQHAQKHIERLQKATGVEPFEGMQPQMGTADQVWKNINAKTHNEELMQIILKKIIEVENIKTKIVDGFTNIPIASETFSKQYIDSRGITRFRNIDPRDALFEETDGDPFLLQSPYLGERRLMFEHDILSSWSWNDDQRKKIRSMFKAETNNTISANTTRRRSFMYSLLKYRAVETFTLEWYALKPMYNLYKRSKDGQLLNKALDHNWYQQNQDKINSDIKKGARLETKYKLVLIEATQVGESLWTNVQEVPNIIGNIENPYETISNYSGLLFNTKDGIRVSLQEQLENFSELYNVVMWQIRRDINKAKGKVVPYNRAWLPKGVPFKKVIERIVEEGIYDYDTTADGTNYAAQRQSIQQMMKEIDWGVSESIGRLIEIKHDIESTVDKLTGINDNREGNIAASSTATNANASIQISRTITEYMFYMHSKYIEMCLKKVMEHGKLSFGEINPELGRQLLGDDAIPFLNSIRDLPNDSFGLFMGDPSKELELRQKFEAWLPQAINAQELRIVDAIKIDMSESINEAMRVAEEGWKTVQDIADKRSQAQSQQEMAIEQKRSVQADKQKLMDYRTKIDGVLIQGLVKAGLLKQEAVNQYLLDMKQVQMEQQDVDNQLMAEKQTG